MDKKAKKVLKGKFSSLIVILIGALLFAFIFLPIYYIVTMSIKSQAHVISGEFSLFFFDISFDAWRETLTSESIWNGLWGSMKTASISTVIAVIIGTLAAYGFSRYTFKRDDDLLFFILTQRMLPPIAIFLPYTLIWRYLDIVGEWYNLIIPYVLISIPITVWLMHAYIDNIPIEYEESAVVEGCSQFEAFWRIVLPNALPGLIMTAMFNFALLWNEIFFALFFRNRTLPVEVSAGLQYAEITPWPSLSAQGVFLMVIPATFAFYLQKRIRELPITF
ncbi:MAG: carbohydrate ABC transporter permease [Halanaerobiales bacterium]|nr:carbohydrate ABC transporter permease [Halanaerobiales bacterium]